MEEHSKYLEGVQYRIEQFQASVQNLANTFMSSDFLKGAINGATTFVNLTETIISNLGAIPSLVGAISAAIGAKWNVFGDLFDVGIGGRGNVLPVTDKTNIEALAGSGNAGIKALINYYNELGKTTENAAQKQELFVSQVASGNPQLAAYFNSVKGGTASFKAYSAQLVAATIKTTALKVVTMALQGVFFAFVGYIVSKGFEALDGYIHKNENLIKAGEEAKQSIEDISSSMKNQQKLIKESGQRYAELAQGVDQLSGKNVSLSDEDYAEFLDISNQLAEVFPDLTKGYTKNGDAILKLNGSVKTITSSLNDLLDAEIALNKQEMINKLPEVFDGIIAANEKLQDDFTIAVNDTKQAEKYMKMLKAVGAEFFEVFYSNGGTGSSQATGFRVKNYDFLNEDNIRKISEQFGEESKDLVKQLYSVNNQIDSSYRSLSASLSYWVQDEFDFLKIENGGLQTSIQEFINNLDFKSLKFESLSGLQQWVRDNILSVITDNPELEEGLTTSIDLITQFNNDEISYSEYKKQTEVLLALLEQFKVNDKVKASILLSLGIDTDENNNVVNTSLNNLVEQMDQSFAKNGMRYSKSVYEKIASELSGTQLKALENSGIDWATIINVNDFEKAVKEVKAQADELSRIPFEIEFNEDAIEEAQGGMKRLQEVYEDLVNANKEGKSGADLASSFTELNKLLEESSKDANDAIKVSDATWQEFFNTMTDGQHTFEEMEAALNKVVTEYVTGTIDIQNFDEAMAKTMSTQLQKFGATKESADAYVATMTDVANTLKQAQDEGHNLISVLDDEAIAWINSADMSDKAREQLALVVLQKQLVNGITINTEGDIKNLQQLMAWAGVTSDSLNKIVQLKKLLNGIISNEQRTNIEKKIDELENQTEDELNTAIAEKMNQYVSLKQDVNKIKDKSKSGSSGSSKDVWKEAYEKELSELDKLHEMELISDFKYYEKREELNDKYFKGREKYTEEYNKNLSEIYKGFKSAYKQYVDEMSDYWKKSLDANKISFQDYCNNILSMLNSLHDSNKIDDETYYSKLTDYYGSLIDEYDKVISAVQRKLKKQVDDLNKQKDNIKSIYETRIKSIQDEIDALNKANDARKKELELQQALYELNRAENQKTQFRYESDKGFVYRANEKDIKNSQEEIEQLRFEQHISSLEESIESLQNEMDNLVDSIDAQIDKIQEYSDKWGEVANKYKEQQEDIVAAAILGSNWQTDILELNETTLSDFTRDYMTLQQNQADAAVNTANVIVEAYNKQIEALNKWKEAQSTSAQTSGTSELSKKSIVPTESPSGTPKDDNKSRNIASRVNALMASANINKRYAKNNSKLASHYAYGSGTDKARPGYHEVAEGGDEILVDNNGNAFLLKGKQLHRFEGGEKVYSSNETDELLKGQYIPIDSILPNYSSMLSKVMSNPISSNMNMGSNNLSSKNQTTPMKLDNSIHIDIGDIHVTEVDNASEIAKAIKNQLPNALLQELNRK